MRLPRHTKVINADKGGLFLPKKKPAAEEVAPVDASPNKKAPLEGLGLERGIWARRDMSSSDN
jgi:hypothetical protein